MVRRRPNRFEPCRNERLIRASKRIQDDERDPAMSVAIQTPARLRVEAILAFLAIYVIWGSTFLAIRYAVVSIPPLFTAATRHLVAGSILLGWALWKGERPTREGWRAGLVLGFLFFFVSHGLLHWAELSVPSGVAALVIAVEPAIVALLLPALKLGPPPRGITWAGLAVGAASVALLFRPDVSAGEGMSVGLLAVLVSATAWSLGIVYARKLQPASGATLNAALPLVCGSLMLLVGAFLRGEHLAFRPGEVPFPSIAGLLFLIFFGSLTAFSAYAWLLKRYDPTLVATHTYVNPIVAVLLGWAFAGEKLTGSVLLSMGLAVFAIWLVNRGSRRAAPRQPPVAVAVEPGG
jgi:drug/metabolite transporter (DMT)-like permease